MTKKRESRTATFDAQYKSISLWLTLNMWGYRDCASLDEARELIEQTGVPQNLIEGRA